MDRVINLLKSINRPGTEHIIAYLRESNFATARCYSHHKEVGGLVEHSLEVCNFMLKHKDSIPADSAIICGLFHDLGKSRRAGNPRIKGHYLRSVIILDMCGYQLTEAERAAIKGHHSKNYLIIAATPLRRLLSLGDMISTRRWKDAHRSHHSRNSHRTTNHRSNK